MPLSGDPPPLVPGNGKEPRLIGDLKVDPAAGFAKDTIIVPWVSAVSQTNASLAKLLPGYAFTVEKVESFCRTKAGTITFDVLVDSAVVVNDGAPVADTRTEHSFESGYGTIYARRGSKTSTLTARFTSDGSGAVTNGFIAITIRPFPAGGEVV